RRAADALAALPPAVSPALPAAMTTERLEAWLADRERALETRTELRRARRERDAARADAAAARATLAGALDAAAVRYPAEAGFEALLKLAGEAVERDVGRRALHAAVTACRDDAATRQRALAAATAADAEWQAGWTQACAGCWLGEAG